MLLKFFRTLFVLFSIFTACTAAAAERYTGGQVENNKIHGPVTVPVTILSIIPTQAEPGVVVKLYGSGFGDQASIYLGSVEISSSVIGGRQAEFNVPPQLEEGLYALYLKRSDGVIGRSYNFNVLPVRPVLKSLVPASINACDSGKEREVIANGSNFSDTSMLFFDGAVVSSSLISPESISFLVPTVPGGLHHVLVKNAPENSSVPLILAVENKPAIGQVTVGNEYVNYYELIINGSNFSQNSSLYVDGVQVGGRGGHDMTEREKLIYVDCTKLIYQRHPYSPVNKDFRLQVVNSGVDGSQVITVTAP